MIDEKNILKLLKNRYDFLSTRDGVKHDLHALGEMDGLALAMILIKREIRRNKKE